MRRPLHWRPPMKVMRHDGDWYVKIIVCMQGQFHSIFILC